MQWKVLGGLRFLLAGFIVCAQLSPFILHPEKDFLYELRRITPIGDVIALLLISGYSIANSITKNPEGFYKRRIIRIYPLYFCAIILSILPFLFFGPEIQLHGQVHRQPDLVSVVGYLTLLQGFVFGSLSANSPLWPLGILAFAYLFTPIFNRFSSKVLICIIGISASLYVLIPYFYQVLYQNKLPYYSFLGYNLPFCLFLWVWLLGFLYFREQEKRWAKILLIGGCIMLIMNQSHTGIISIIVYLLTCMVLIYSAQIKLPSWLINSFNYLGNIAYPFYLFHKPTFVFSYKILGVNNSVTLMLLSLVVGMFFYHAIDIPLRSRNRTIVTT